MKIYVASSWRNETHPMVVERLRQEGHEVYDFKHPKEDDNGFHWSEIDHDYKYWNVPEFIDALSHPLAGEGYKNDIEAMEWADAIVLVLSSGRSAHLELGWGAGKGLLTIIYLPEGIQYEPELMYKMADYLTPDLDEVVDIVRLAAPKTKIQRALNISRPLRMGPDD